MLEGFPDAVELRIMSVISINALLLLLSIFAGESQLVRIRVASSYERYYCVITKRRWIIGLYYIILYYMPLHY